MNYKLQFILRYKLRYILQIKEFIIKLKLLLR